MVEKFDKTVHFRPQCDITLKIIKMTFVQAIYAPNFEKVVNILVSACVCVCVCVCVCHRDIVLKLHVWIPHGKIADAYFGSP